MNTQRTLRQKLLPWEDKERPITYPFYVCALDIVNTPSGKLTFTESKMFPDETSLLEYVKQKRV